MGFTLSEKFLIKQLKMSDDKEAIPSFELNDVTISDLDRTLMEDLKFANVSFSRGSERSPSSGKCRGFCSFLDAFGGNATPKQRLSFEIADISDSDFLDSDAGKEMIVKDQEFMEQEVTLPYNDVDCAGCSSWVPVTSKKLTSLSMEEGQLMVSIGGYIRKRSEYLGHLSHDSLHIKEFFNGYDASTPARTKSEISIIDKQIADLADFSKWTVSENHEYRNEYEHFNMTPKMLYSTPKTKKPEYPDPLHYFIGTTCYKNIQKLKAEERIQNKNLLPESTRNSPEQWTIHPQLIVLDATKGTSRVQLINNSNRDIKFKAKFDGQVINVCPLLGTMRAKNVLGLRVLVLRSSKMPKEDIETSIKIIGGQRVKTVHVKLLSSSKSYSSVKDRSFILH